MPAKAPYLSQSKRITSPVAIMPSPREAQHLIALFERGRLPQAEVAARKIILQCPAHSFGWKALGTILQKQGRFEDAVKAYHRAAALPPADPEIQNNLGNAYLNSGQPAPAESNYRAAIKLRPEYAEAHVNLGIALARLNRHAEAELCYLRAIELRPTFAVAYSNLGHTLHKLGRLADAESHLRQALELSPEFPEATCHLGSLLQELGQLNEAESLYRRALELNPLYAEACVNLGTIHQLRGDFAGAETAYRNAIELNPTAAEPHSNLGLCLALQHHYPEAESCYHRAITLKLDYAAPHNNLGNLYHAHGRYTEAELLYCRAIELDPNYADAHSNLGNALLYLGNPAAAAENYRRAITLRPSFTDAFSNYLFCLTHNPRLNQQTLSAEHRAYGIHLASHLQPQPNSQPHSNPRDPDRPLRIGIVSDDFRYHPIARFTESLLHHLSLRDDLSLHAFYSHPTEDEVTQRFRGYFREWHSTTGLNNVELADAVRAHSIDILIDLSGHTASNRLPAFAYKPAPVQVSWLGYAGTTGLPAMDYFITDPTHLPADEFAAAFTEKLVHLPITATFLPTQDAPPINLLPALNGNPFTREVVPFTFASFNRLLKLNPQVIALWSQLLRAVPNSRMLLGGMAHDDRAAQSPGNNAHGRYSTLVDWFAHNGIPANRLSFYEAGSAEFDMALHHQVDLCLDAFPYNGSTTIHNSLWMGVPTLTLRGHTTTSRMGAAIQTHLNLHGFIAHTLDDFVQKGIAWSQSIPQLAVIRAGLREEFRRSPIFQHEQCAATVAAAWRKMWHLYCAGKPPEAIHIG